MSHSFIYISSTVLFVDSHPIGYKIFLADEKYMLQPADIPDDSFHPPVLFAQRSQGVWIITGTSDQDLRDQVIEDISSVGLEVPNKKAAPLRTALT